jgi:hypothetical protein
VAIDEEITLRKMQVLLAFMKLGNLSKVAELMDESSVSVHPPSLPPCLHRLLRLCDLQAAPTFELGLDVVVAPLLIPPPSSSSSTPACGPSPMENVPSR